MLLLRQTGTLLPGLSQPEVPMVQQHWTLPSRLRKTPSGFGRRAPQRLLRHGWSGGPLGRRRRSQHHGRTLWELEIFRENLDKKGVMLRFFPFSYGLYFPLPRDPITCAAAFTFSFLFCTLVTLSDSFSSFPFMLDSYGLIVTPTLYRVWLHRLL